MRYVFFIALWIASCTCHAATLHVVIAADTHCNIGNGIVHDIEMIEQEVNRIALLTDLELNKVVFDGYSYRPDLVWNHIANLSIEPEDVVLYFHFSHGFGHKDSIWPQLSFGLHPFLSFEDVILLVYNKHPRFGFLVADACNAHHASMVRHDTDTLSDLWKWLFPPHRKENYVNLFLNQRGVMAVSSSISGQLSWISMERGSIFTISLLESLSTQTESPGASWDDIFELASQKTQWISTHAKNGALQVPQWQFFSYD